MKIHFTYPSADGRTLIHAIRWIPDNQKPVGILQIAHGMVEFIDRYDEFARFLNRKGYVVVGNDHLGHGGSVVSHHDLGHFGEVAGYKVLISDMHIVPVPIIRICPILCLGTAWGLSCFRPIFDNTQKVLRVPSSWGRDATIQRCF